MSKQTKLIYGVDLGGTVAKCGVSNTEGEILTTFRVQVGLGDEVIPNLRQGLLDHLKENDWSYDQVVLVAFAHKGPYDKDRNLILNAQGVGWINYPVLEVARRVFQKEIVINNDSRSACYGEWKRGAGKNYSHFAVVTMGQGIGCGLVLNNELYVGKHNLAGEIGHGGNFNAAFPCNCGLKNCVEAVSSASSITKMINQAAVYYQPNSLSRLRDAKKRPLTIIDSVPLLRAGDPLTVDVWEKSLTPLAERLSLAIFLLDLDAIIIGGGPSAMGELLISILKRLMKPMLWDHYQKHVDLKIAALGNAAGLVGIISYALDVYHQHTPKK